MANPEHLKILKQGVEAWNKRRQEDWRIEPDLSGADLSGANLSEANFREVNLSGANLTTAKLNLANLYGANLARADLSEAELLKAQLLGVNLSEADLSNASLIGAICNLGNFHDATFRSANLREANLYKVDLSGANLSEANLYKADLSGATLYAANLYAVDLRMADLRNSNLIEANLNSADLREARLGEANLSRALLTEANLNRADLFATDFCQANMQRANLKDVHLCYCYLVQTDLTGSTLTGAKLYGTARDDWVIKDVRCDYVYWDRYGEQRSPKDRDLEPGEFELLYATLPTFDYIFENGMTPIDPLIMDRVVQAIRERRPEFDIKIDSLNARGLAPSIRFTIRHEEHKKLAFEAVKKEYEIKLRQLESERDRYYQLLAHALDAPKEVKLINAAPGSIVATDGSTVSVEQHIHNALELQKAITDEPEESESFAKVAKNTALDIIGEAIKDVAKGQVKEAAKEIFELGKDLGPLFVRMAPAAYAFFKSIGV